MDTNFGIVCCSWGFQMIQALFNLAYSLYFYSDNMHLKFTAKNIVSSLVEEQEKAIQRHGMYLYVTGRIILIYYCILVYYLLAISMKL